MPTGRLTRAVCLALACTLMVAATLPATHAYTLEQCTELASCPTAYPTVYALLGACQCCPVSSPDSKSLGCTDAPLRCGALTGCVTCPDGISATCTQCATGYVLGSDGTCKPCAANCDACTADSEGLTCELCSSGFHWVQGGACEANEAGGSAASYSDAGECRASFCKQCESRTADTCSHCAEGTELDINGLCVNSCRVANCDACLSGNTTQCLVCSPNYQWVSGTCEYNSSGCRLSNCHTCKPSDSSFCAACETGFTLTSTGYCIADVACEDTNCTSCPTSASTCDRCTAGYGLVNGACHACETANCDSCDGDATRCTQCAASYYLTSLFSCSPTPCSLGHCLQCDTSDASRCASCISPYQSDTYDGQCIQPGECEVANCQSCKDGSSRLCAACEEGASLSSDGTQCTSVTTQACEVANCQKCRSGDSLMCDVCDASFYQMNGVCQLIGSCFVTNCAQCVLLDNTVCTTCMDGFQLTSSNYCVAQKTISSGAAAPYSLWMAASVLLASVVTYVA